MCILLSAWSLICSCFTKRKFFHTFRPCLPRTSFLSIAGKWKVCDRFDAGCGLLYMAIPSASPLQLQFGHWWAETHRYTWILKIEWIYSFVLSDALDIFILITITLGIIVISTSTSIHCKHWIYPYGCVLWICHSHLACWELILETLYLNIFSVELWLIFSWLMELWCLVMPKGDSNFEDAKP